MAEEKRVLAIGSTYSQYSLLHIRQEEISVLRFHCNQVGIIWYKAKQNKEENPLLLLRQSHFAPQNKEDYYGKSIKGKKVEI